jgi:hypothetical protein
VIYLLLAFLLAFAGTATAEPKAKPFVFSGRLYTSPEKDKPLGGLCEFDREMLPIRCIADTEDCYPSCGLRLTEFTDAVDYYIEQKLACGRRHCPGWTLVLRGRIRIDFASPWEMRADRVRIDCHGANLEAGGQVPTVSLGVGLQPGQQEVPVSASQLVALGLHPGDIVVSSTGHQAPIRAVHADRISLARPWGGPAQPTLTISTGRVIRLDAESVSFVDACPVYEAWGARWSKGQRFLPVTVVETPGWDLEDGFHVTGFTHPGDYHHANTSSSSAGGTNGVRYTGGVEVPGSIVLEHAALLRDGYPADGFGAAFLLMANTVDMRGMRRQMNSAFRCFEVYGGHKIELSGVCEGPAQALWAPQGVASLIYDGQMNHMNQPSVPRDFPPFDLGNRPTNPSHVIIRTPLLLFQWGQGQERRALVRARGKPVHLWFDGSLRNFEGDPFDLPDGSKINGAIHCDDGGC